MQQLIQMLNCNTSQVTWSFGLILMPITYRNPMLNQRVLDISFFWIAHMTHLNHHGLKTQNQLPML
jgi:hypothetical protein